MTDPPNVRSHPRANSSIQDASREPRRTTLSRPKASSRQGDENRTSSISSEKGETKTGQNSQAKAENLDTREVGPRLD